LSEEHPERQRLQKGDVDLIAQALEAQDFNVFKTAARVEGCCQETGRYICGFYWQSAQDDRPQGWRFDLALADTFSLKDLKSAITEAKRVRRMIPRCREAWQRFVRSRSAGRWMDYRGHVASLFMRQDTK
jgi:hypothetical protein